MSSEQSNILKRHEQISNWSESVTDKASKAIKDAEKIQFTKEVQFLSACNNNDWEEIRRLLSEGIDINSTQDDGLTSLHQACIDDDEGLVKYLIEHGADIDAQDKEGWTPLFAAISCNYLPITKYLVSRGARLDMVSFDGELPLDQSNNETIASFIKEQMIKGNLDPEEIRNRERNIMLSDIELMKTTNDFSKFTLVDNGGSLLHIAACKDYMDVLEKLLEIISQELLNHTDNDGWNALHVAAHWGNRKACVMLINADIDFEIVTFSKQTVLEVSDDDVKPYIREEIRKARFRRQEKASIKRPAEPPNPEYQPSDTKIICQDKTALSPVENQQQKSNGDKHVIATEDRVTESFTDIHEPMTTTPGESTKTVSLIDVDLKPETNEMVPSEPEGISLANSSITLPEPAPASSMDISTPIPKKENSQTTNDIKSPKVVVPVLTPSKVAESESQRKDKARHVRSTRRLTQGVTAEEIDEAKKMISVDTQNISGSSAIDLKSNPDKIDGSLPRENHQDCLVNETKPDLTVLDNPHQLTTDKLINGNGPPSDITNQISELPNVIISVSESEALEQADKKGRAGSHVVNKRRTRERPPTGIVDPKDIQAALLLNEPSKLPKDPIQKEPEIDYKVLYEMELKEMDKLQRNVARLRQDLEHSEDKIKSLQNNHVVSKLQTSSIISPGCDIKEIEKLRDDNKKMKEANSALIRVISRLSRPSSQSMTGSN